MLISFSWDFNLQVAWLKTQIPHLLVWDIRDHNLFDLQSVHL